MENIITNCNKIQKIQKIQLWLLFKQKLVGKGLEKGKIQKKLKKDCYGFFSSKNWLEKAEKERKYKLSFRFVPTQCVIEHSKQIAKKCIKLEEYHFGFI